MTNGPKSFVAFIAFNPVTHNSPSSRFYSPTNVFTNVFTHILADGCAILCSNLRAHTAAVLVAHSLADLCAVRIPQLCSFPFPIAGTHTHTDRGTIARSQQVTFRGAILCSNPAADRRAELEAVKICFLLSHPFPQRPRRRQLPLRRRVLRGSVLHRSVVVAVGRGDVAELFGREFLLRHRHVHHDALLRPMSGQPGVPCGNVRRQRWTRVEHESHRRRRLSASRVLPDVLPPRGL